MGAKESINTVRAFSTTITKQNCVKKIWVDKGAEFAGDFKTFCIAQRIQIYSTMSDTGAEFPERTIRSSKNILYFYMEDYG